MEMKSSLESNISQRTIKLTSLSGASEASSKWVGKTKNHYTGSKKWVGKHFFSLKIKQKSGWVRAQPTHPASTPLLLFTAKSISRNKWNRV